VLCKRCANEIASDAEGTVRIIEIAELLGVSKQRVHQIADEEGFPAPVA